MKYASLISLLAIVSFLGCNKQPQSNKAEIELSDQVSAVKFKGEGETSQIVVNATKGWQITVEGMQGEKGWIEVNPQSGSAGKTTVNLSAATNNTGKERSAKLVVKSPNEQLNVSLTQSSYAFLAGDNTTEQVNYQGGTVMYGFEHSGNYTITISDDWVTEVKAANMTTKAPLEQIVTFQVAENNDDERTATVTISCEGCKDLELTIVQHANTTSVFEVSQNTFDIGSEGGDIELTITSSVGYKISSMPAWITETAKESVSKRVTKYQFKVQANTESSRTGVIVICNDYQQCVPVNINQAAGSTANENFGEGGAMGW